MDIIKLSKEIDNKIKKAESTLPYLLEEMQQFEGLRITHRIKDKNRILEKIMLWSTNPKHKDVSEFELLEKVGDIIGITVVIEKLDDAFNTANTIIKQLESKTHQSINFYKCIDHIRDNGGITGYKGLLLIFSNKDNIPFEIQVTDEENFKIREDTHDEFVKNKYSSVKTQTNQKTENYTR